MFSQIGFSEAAYAANDVDRLGVLARYNIKDPSWLDDPQVCHCNVFTETKTIYYFFRLIWWRPI